MLKELIKSVYTFKYLPSNVTEESHLLLKVRKFGVFVFVEE
jgi:hypothetical protein